MVHPVLVVGNYNLEDFTETNSRSQTYVVEKSSVWSSAKTREVPSMWHRLVMEALYLCVLAILVPTGSALMIEVSVPSKQPLEGETVLIGCREEPSDALRIGQLTHLSIEKITQQEIPTESTQYPGSPYYQRSSIIEKVMTPVVTLSWGGEVKWGSGYDSSRTSVTGEIQKNSSSLTLSINKTRCTDGPLFICVARGDRATVDSPPHGLSVVAIPGEMKITGGRNCPLSLHQSRDHCDLYARPGDEIDLVCKARVGQPLIANYVNWAGQNAGLMISQTIMSNSSSDTCSGEVTSALNYKFVPTDPDSDVILTCKVTFTRDFGEFVGSKNVTICREIPQSESRLKLAGQDVYTRDHIIGIFFAGFGTMLLIFILVLLVMCCCGCRLGVKRKHQLDVSNNKQGKF